MKYLGNFLKVLKRIFEARKERERRYSEVSGKGDR